MKESGASAVKLEGGEAMAETMHFDGCRHSSHGSRGYEAPVGALSRGNGENSAARR